MRQALVPSRTPHPAAPPPLPERATLSRVLLVTGKGGVGKTSVAAATAVRAARRGQRVLVTSTDPAHSLADAFGTPLGDAPAAVPGLDGLSAQQIDAQDRLERHWREVRDYLVALLAWGGVRDVQAEELVLLPGLDELFSLIDLDAQVRSGHYELIVVDCAPTAETLRLLALPEALRFYVDRVLGPGWKVARALRPLSRVRGDHGRTGPVPVPDDEVFHGLRRIHRDLAAVHALLQDPRRASVRLVANAERLVVHETERTATSLSLFGYAVDAVVVNRLLPDAVTDPYLTRWKARQAEHLATVEARFAPTPVLTAPLFADELDGLSGLEELGEALYGDVDESAALTEHRPLEVVDRDGLPCLRLALPFVARNEVDLLRRDGDLHVKAAGVARRIPLPRALRDADIVGAGVSHGYLEVRFAAVDRSGRRDATDPYGTAGPTSAVGS